MGRNIVEGGVLVVGLGRFGSTLAKSLERSGTSVIAVDPRQEVVQEMSNYCTHVVQADWTSEEALRQVGAGDCEVAVVAIGTDIEASILATSVLVDIGIPHIWAKAVTEPHGRILSRVGAHHVVYPEQDAGKRVAHLLTERILDFIDLGDGHAIVKISAHRGLRGRSLAESHLRSKYGVTVVAIKRQDGRIDPAAADTVVGEGDQLIVMGETRDTERFAAE
ncbi:trk system potassium uptake protein TrkA [Motilibacter peucedani]|uniref:Trk system potassium uptake protein TrkA n=1 Tax=Motilibacter peucedani TaxID=598650 RepID=A0A420XRI1_9ACTN|nr:TrkA family potassium uptake protein [Motilibacter peucedani]RKS77488.1 trk system potassium uptake protein TrkA [Motilibacter peucedani]